MEVGRSPTVSVGGQRRTLNRERKRAAGALLKTRGLSPIHTARLRRKQTLGIDTLRQSKFGKPVLGRGFTQMDTDLPLSSSVSIRGQSVFELIGLGG